MNISDEYIYIEYILMNISDETKDITVIQEIPGELGALYQKEESDVKY